MRQSVTRNRAVRNPANSPGTPQSVPGMPPRAGLHDIARAEHMSRLAREVGMSREGFCKALSKNGNPAFATVMRITRASGMKVRITA